MSWPSDSASQLSALRGFGVRQPCAPAVERKEDSIPIPVKHIPIAISQNQAPQASQQPAHGLKSPSVLQNVNNVAPKSPFQFPHRPAGEGMEKMPNFFDEFGAPKDPETSIMQMRKRMEEAKQRMALSLPA